MKKTIALVVSLVFAFATFGVYADSAVAIKDVKPIYPKSALERKLTGWVVVEYTVNEDGRAENITVSDSEPAKVFDRAAKRAISQTRFEVQGLDGGASEGTNQRKKFVFEIDEVVPGTLAAR